MSRPRRPALYALLTTSGLGLVGLILWWVWPPPDPIDVAPDGPTTTVSDSQPADSLRPIRPDDAPWPFDDPNYAEVDDPERTWATVASAVQQTGLGTVVRCAVPPEAPSLYPHHHHETLGYKRTETHITFVAKGPLRTTMFNGPRGRAIARATWNADGSGCEIEPMPEQFISGTLRFPPGFDPNAHDFVVCGATVEVGPDGFFELRDPIPARIRADGSSTILTCGIHLDGVELDEVEFGEPDLEVYADPSLLDDELATSDEEPWEGMDPLPSDRDMFLALDQQPELLDEPAKRWVEEGKRALKLKYGPAALETDPNTAP